MEGENSFTLYYVSYVFNSIIFIGFLLSLIIIAFLFRDLHLYSTTPITPILFHHGKYTRLSLQCTLYRVVSLFQEVHRIDTTANVPQNTDPVPSSVVIERRKPILESCIWKLQREYYESLTSDAAVAKSSGFTISSNCYVARVGFIFVFHL